MPTKNYDNQLEREREHAEGGEERDDAAARLFCAVQAKEAAQERLVEARLALREEIRAAAAAGISQYQIARLAGVDRMTVRHALGKSAGGGWRKES